MTLLFVLTITVNLFSIRLRIPKDSPFSVLPSKSTSSHTGPVIQQPRLWQIDFVLNRKSLRKLVMNVKVIPGEEVALQHQLLVYDMMVDMPQQIKPKFTPHPKVWKLRDPQTCS